MLLAAAAFAGFGIGCSGSSSFKVDKAPEQLALQHDELPTGSAGNLYAQTSAHPTTQGEGMGYVTSYSSPSNVSIESTVLVFPTKAQALDYARAASDDLAKQGFTRAQDVKIGDLTTTGSNVTDQKGGQRFCIDSNQLAFN